MNKNVTIIPPSEDRPAILRVAAYCRVSTDSDDQATSYASQIRSYTELISQHEGWELVDIYADEAVSGTKTDKRGTSTVFWPTVGRAKSTGCW